MKDVSPQRENLFMVYYCFKDIILKSMRSGKNIIQSHSLLINLAIGKNVNTNFREFQK